MGGLRPPQEVFERRPKPSHVPGIGCNLPLPIFFTLTSHSVNLSRDALSVIFFEA